MNYTEYVASLANMLNIDDLAQPNFVQILPRCIEFAELMMYRDPDLDFLGIHEADTSKTFSAASRNLTLPTNMIVVEGINAILPAATAPDSGTRHPLQRVTQAFLDNLAPAVGSYSGIPVYWDQLNDTTIRVAPTPDAAYKAELLGTFRPTALSSGNPTTFITNNLPDLFLSASMIFMSGYQRDFGAQAEDPKMALSWTSLYAAQKQLAAVESARQKAQSAGWTPLPATPAATPPRS